LVKSGLLQLIGLTCERALAGAQIRGSRRCGPFGLALGFKSPALANAIEPLFPAACRKDHDLTITFLNRRDLDLSNLIPDPPDVHHAVTAAADYHAAWWPGERPVLYLLDKSACRGLVWFAADEAPSWELSRPALPLIQAISADTAWTPAHGAAVGRDGRFLLLAGEGRSGKTTAALACAQAGWDYAGDDYVIAHTKSGRVEPLYTSARLRIDVAAAFAELVGSASSGVTNDDGDTRHELRLAGALPKQIRGGRLAAILLPRRQGSPVPTFAPARRLDAFEGLMRHTVQSLRSWHALLSVKLADLVGCAPTFFVDTGTDPALVPPALGDLLDKIGD
jgi:hypothetical protein